MSKIVKIKQKDVESIVKNVIQENEEIDERVFGIGNEPEVGTRLVYAAKDKQGNYYIIDAKTNEILAKDNPNKDVADDNLPMAAE
jgi:hypothetical protein